jgi:hypothetical protein
MQLHCKTCAQVFTHNADDVELLKELAPRIGDQRFDIPAPTRCPECRLALKMAFDTNGEMYRRNDSWSGASILSIYPPEAPFPVISQSAWYADGWDALQPRVEQPPTERFIERLHALRNIIPRPAQKIVQSENCDYCSLAYFSKNCYLLYGAAAEDCMYGYISNSILRCLDFSFAIRSRYCYQIVECQNCERVFFSHYAESCSDCAFLFDCKSCRDCFGCVNLRHKQFCVFNQQLSEAEYRRFIADVHLERYSILQQWQQKFLQFKLQQAHRAAYQFRCENCVGDNITGLKDCYYCFGADSLGAGIENCRYASLFGGPANHCMDTYGTSSGSFCYGCGPVCFLGTSLLFSSNTEHSDNCIYCDLCDHCSDCFGCVGLRHKRYCILNVQYSQQEYQQLASDIIHQLVKQGTWGEYLPPHLSPFPYNQSRAQDQFPLSASLALERGFKWADHTPESTVAQSALLASELPEDSSLIEGAIEQALLSSTFLCLESGRPYRITRRELDFYREYKLALPRLHPRQRQHARSRMQNPYRLWQRACAECQTLLHTSYSPQRPERVVCDECYRKITE